MVIDHIGLRLFPDIIILRVIGRIAFPLFAFFIFEGFRHTCNKMKYFFNIFGLGSLCVLGYYVYFKEIYANVLITFSFSIVLLSSIYFFRSCSAKSSGFHLFVGSITLIISICFVVAMCRWIRIDYGFFGVILPVFPEIISKETRDLHSIKADNSLLVLLAFSLGVMLLSFNLGGIQYFGLLSLLILLNYNGKNGEMKMNKFYYWFYPAHLVVIGFLEKIFIKVESSIKITHCVSEYFFSIITWGNCFILFKN